MISMRSANFTSEEIEVLINEIEKRPHLIHGEFGPDCPTTFHQRDHWAEVASSISAISDTERDWRQVKKKFSDMKSRTKKKTAALNGNSQYTLELPKPLFLTRIEERIANMVGLPPVSEEGDIIPNIKEEGQENCVLPKIEQVVSYQSSSNEPEDYAIPCIPRPKKIKRLSREAIDTQRKIHKELVDLNSAIKALTSVMEDVKNNQQQQTEILLEIAGDSGTSLNMIERLTSALEKQ